MVFTSAGKGKAGDDAESQDWFHKSHEKSDVDFAPDSQHHTLGKGPLNAAPGNHDHDLVYAPNVHTHEGLVPPGCIMFWGADPTDIPSGWALLDGTGVLQESNPELTAKYGPVYGTYTFAFEDYVALPDLRLRIPFGGYDGTVDAGTNDGEADVDLRPTSPDLTHDHTISDGSVTAASANNTSTGGGATRLTSLSGGTHAHGGATGSDSPVLSYFTLHYIIKLG